MKFLNAITPTLAFLATTHASSLKSLLSHHPKLSILHSLLLQFELLEDFNELSNITLLAPTDQAYLDLANWGFNVSQVPTPVARALLSYHVLNGNFDSQTLSRKPQVIHTYLTPPVLTNVSAGAAVKLHTSSDGTTLTESGLGVVGGVEEADLEFDSGVVHTLNSSMVLPHNITLTAGINGLTRFLELVEMAGLTEEFEALKDVTVFIPTNGALRKVSGLVSLLARRQLASVLMGHVIPNQVLYGENLVEGGVFETMSGRNIRVRKTKEGSFEVDGVEVVKQDVILYGGVAHVIGEALASEGEEESHNGDGLVYTAQANQLPMPNV
ncbi:FAS1 domain-containing protein [Paraphoma chrysanthemicola]|uniref:FAS1 domain-containing protein n=1 Tax=Paraphoma chrysanthemicola TaxID=798071 RepID=A0A8K0W3A3_9PLEO|nr:FAS1 domain-containing protein [Paraphoma chrysanthemicola]